ncbi:MAG: hypothetical protein B7Z72_13710 [Gemmatimonadetes bacterium 21-71-4]|nr:MAG: hypothetical protein B7Z72_13710 [Gemmatimonadetes bacterium 21-71-4]
MFIELTEIIRCPNPHPESYLVAAPIVMDGRRIVRGVVGCPECKAEFPIVEGVAYFAGGGSEPGAPREGGAASPAYDASALAAFLNLSGPGGYAVLAGAAARFGAEIGTAVPGVHFVAVNPPPGVAPSPTLTLLRAPRGLPFKSASVRAVALGADLAAEPWLGEAARILLPGLRLVVEGERAEPAEIEELARGAGMFVGVRVR